MEELTEDYLYSCYSKTLLTRSDTQAFTDFTQEHRDIYLRLKLRAVQSLINKFDIGEEAKGIESEPQSTEGSEVKKAASVINSKEDLISFLVDKVSDGDTLIRNELNEVLSSQSKCQARIDSLKVAMEKEIDGLKLTTLENPSDFHLVTN